MFNNKTEEEIDFCESYKSQILNNVTEKKSSSFGTVLKILTILVLLAIIVGLSIYGYNYFMNIKGEDANSILTPPSSIQISDEELKVIDETEEIDEIQNTIQETKNLPTIIEKKDSIEKPASISIMNESDIDKIANDVKIAIAKEEEKEKNKSITQENKENIIQEKSLEVPVPNSPEAKYLEDLAKLSKEIDKKNK